MIPTKKCPHGKLLTQPCLACEKMDKVERHTAQKIADLAAENEQLRAALQPLANQWDDTIERLLDDKPLWGFTSKQPITAGDIKAARAAIARAEEGE